MTAWLTQTSTLWKLFAIFAGLSIIMLTWIIYFDLHIIDETADPAKVLAILDAQTPVQHQAHFWMTLIADIPYPFTYGLLFAGLALRNFGKYGKLLSIPAILSIPSDTIENISQLFILKGHTDWLAVKAIATPIKLVCFSTALLLAVLALIIAIKAKVGKPEI